MVERIISNFYEKLAHKETSMLQKNGENVWEKLLAGVPQVSILDPPLFNIFTNYIFPFLQVLQLVNYADVIAIYTSDRSIKMP